MTSEAHVEVYLLISVAFVGLDYLISSHAVGP